MKPYPPDKGTAFSSLICKRSGLTRCSQRAPPLRLEDAMTLFQSPASISTSSKICVADFRCCWEIGPTFFRNQKSGAVQGSPRWWVWMTLSTSKALLIRSFASSSFISQISRNCLSSMRAKCLWRRVIDQGQLILVPGQPPSPPPISSRARTKAELWEILSLAQSLSPWFSPVRTRQVTCK